MISPNEESLEVMPGYVGGPRQHVDKSIWYDLGRRLPAPRGSPNAFLRNACAPVLQCHILGPSRHPRFVGFHKFRASCNSYFTTPGSPRPLAAGLASPTFKPNNRCRAIPCNLCKLPLKGCPPH